MVLIIPLKNGSVSQIETRSSRWSLASIYAPPKHRTSFCSQLSWNDPKVGSLAMSWFCMCGFRSTFATVWSTVPANSRSLWGAPFIRIFQIKNDRSTLALLLRITHISSKSRNFSRGLGSVCAFIVIKLKNLTNFEEIPPIIKTLYLQSKWRHSNNLRTSTIVIAQ